MCTAVDSRTINIISEMKNGFHLFIVRTDEKFKLVKKWYKHSITIQQEKRAGRIVYIYFFLYHSPLDRGRCG